MFCLTVRGIPEVLGNAWDQEVPMAKRTDTAAARREQKTPRTDEAAARREQKDARTDEQTATTEQGAPNV